MADNRYNTEYMYGSEAPQRRADVPVRVPRRKNGNVSQERQRQAKVLCCCARKSKEIPESYSLKEAIYDLGVLGGTKGAPSDGMPGVRSIWQGLDVLYLSLIHI